RIPCRAPCRLLPHLVLGSIAACDSARYFVPEAGGASAAGVRFCGARNLHVLEPVNGAGVVSLSVHLLRSGNSLGAARGDTRGGDTFAQSGLPHCIQRRTTVGKS